MLWVINLVLLAAIGALIRLDLKLHKRWRAADAQETPRLREQAQAEGRPREPVGDLPGVHQQVDGSFRFKERA